MRRKDIIRKSCVLIMTGFMIVNMLACGERAEVSDQARDTVSIESTDSTSSDTEMSVKSGAAIDHFPDKTDMDMSDASDDGGTYTVMIYMIGSDLESEYQNASKDLLEMMESGVNTSHVNVVVYAGGAKNWWLGIPKDRNSLLELMGEDFGIVGDSPLMNMTSPDTLAEFLNFAYENYPADHYGLIFWDHGSGPVFGYGYDENFENDTMLLPQVTDALKQSPFGKNNKLDWVGYDACLMSCLEVANVWEDYANYLVASQETEPGMGWDYSFLATLNETSNARRIIKSIIDTFGESYQDTTSVPYDPDLTLACMDLSRTSDMNEKVDCLFEAMLDTINQGGYAELTRERNATKEYGLAAVSDRGSAPDVIDLGAFAVEASESYPKETSELLDSLEKMVIYERSNVVDSSGISFYYPYANKQIFEYGGSKLYNLISESENYCKYIEAYTAKWLQDSDASMFRLKFPELEEGISLQLTDEQLQNFSRAYYTVFVETDGFWTGTEGCYAPILTECEIYPDENGFLRVDGNPEVITTESGDLVFWTRQLAHRGDVTEYQLKDAFLQNGSMPYVDTVKIRASLSADSNEKAVRIKEIEEAEDTLRISSRNTINVSDWEAIGRTFCTYRPVQNEEGNMLPYFEWEEGTTYLHIDMEIGEELGFCKKQLSECGTDQYVCQIIVEDRTGEVYATDLKSFYFEKNYKMMTVPTENGSVDCLVYPDHAEIVKYNGTSETAETDYGNSLTLIGEETVVLPDVAGGVPITAIHTDSFGNENETLGKTKKIVIPDSVKEIHASPFRFSSEIEEIVLPQGLQKIPENLFDGCFQLKRAEIPSSVTYIGSAAFAYTSISSAKIPASVQTIMPTAFSGCSELNEFEVDSASQTYKTVEGVLFTKDGKKLVSCPGRSRESYIVPEGVEEICDGAFEGCYDWSLIEDDGLSHGLEAVTLPSTLRKIGVRALSGCCAFEEIVIPDTVESIGSFAFGRYWGDGTTDDTTLVVGKGLKKVGFHAFTSYRFAKIEVSEDNPFLSTKDLRLTNKAEDTYLPIFNTDEKENPVLVERMTEE